MRALLALAALALAGCTLQYTDENARKSDSARSVASSGSTGSTASTVSDSGSGTGNTTTTSATNTDTTGSTTGSQSTTSTSATTGSGTTTSSTSTSGFTNGSSSGTLGGSTGTTATFEQLDPNSPNDDQQLTDVVVTGAQQYMVVGHSGYLIPWSSGLSWGTSFESGLNYPFGIALDSQGNFWVTLTGSDGSGAFIEDISSTNGQAITSISDIITNNGCSDGARQSATFTSPGGIVVLDGGALVIADTGCNTIRYYDPGTQQVTTIAGDKVTNQAGALDAAGNGLQATFNGPTYLAEGPNGEIYISDRGNCRVRVMSGAAPWGVTTLAGSSCCNGSVPEADNVDANLAVFCPTDGVAADSAGNVYVATAYNESNLHLIDTNGTRTVGSDPPGGEMGGLHWVDAHTLVTVDQYGYIWNIHLP